jgi:hypothetical protein
MIVIVDDLEEAEKEIQMNNCVAENERKVLLDAPVELACRVQFVFS